MNSLIKFLEKTSLNPRQKTGILSCLFLAYCLSSQAHNIKLLDCLPETSQKNIPAIIICPGGSYHYLGGGAEGMRTARWLNQNGIAAFVLRYRVAPFHSHPSMIQDLQQAIFYVRENSSRFGIDPNKVGVMGFSAGGHLAGISAIYGKTNFLSEHETKGISLQPNFIAMIYPVVTMEKEDIVHKRSRRGLLGWWPSKEMKDTMSLEKHIDKNMPPVFLMHTKKDPVVNYRNSLYLAEALQKAGAEYRFLLYETGIHGFGIDAPKGGEALQWSTEFLIWLKQRKF